MKTLYACFIIVILTLTIFSQNLEEIKWLTEDYPPFNYMENDELKGFTVDILIEVWKKVGLKKTVQDIQLLPWSRGIKMLDEDKTVCLFGMGITQERMSKYKFIKELPGSVRVLIAKKIKKYTFSSIDEVNKNIPESKIGIARGDIGGQTFLEMGGNKKLLFTVNKGGQLIQMLHMGRIDLIAYNDIAAIKNMRLAHIDPSEYEIVLTLSQGISGYAFNNQVNTEILEKLQHAFDELVKDGTVARIRNAYISFIK